ncbi:MAG: SCO1664 family protein [Candidatus Dormibacteria bacterium]
MPPQERKEPRLLTPAAAAELMATGHVEVVDRLAHSSNATFLVTCGRDNAQVTAVYKPVAGERPLWDFPSDSLFRREVAAYELSRWLRWDLVPTTVGREAGPLGPGSMQLFIEHDPEQHYFSLMNSRRRVFRRLAFFDLLANNADRKSGHCIVDRAGRIWAIDHGLTFHEDPKLRTVIWDFAGESLPAVERRAAARLVAALEDGRSEIASVLATLLDPAEVRGLAQRAASLAAGGRFPSPASSWSFPWPLV